MFHGLRPTKPFDRRFKRTLTEADRARLATILMESKTRREAAQRFGCTVPALARYVAEEGFTSIMSSGRPSYDEYPTVRNRTALHLGINRFAPITELAEIAGGVSRQAVHQYLKRSGLWEFWRRGRAERSGIVRRSREEAAAAKALQRPMGGYLLTAAALLAAKGHTVEVCNHQLYCDDLRVRLAPRLAPNGSGYLRTYLYNQKSIYVVLCPGGAALAYWPPHASGWVHLRQDGSQLQHRTGNVPLPRYEWPAVAEAA